MAYTPLDFALFLAKTRNLEIQYSTLLGRYKIKSEAPVQVKQPPVQEQVVQSGLEILLARVHEVNTCKTERKTAQDVFIKLTTELRDVLKENNEERNRQASLYLLGALLHRYFRIIKEYQNKNSYTYFSLFAANEKNCNLFKAIRSALGLPPEMDENYRAQDLKILDEVTIVKALEIFKKNMLATGGKETPKYKSYPHFAQDRNFEEYLQDIIDEHKKKGGDLLKEFQAIGFIESLALYLDEEQRRVVDDINKWSVLLKKEHPDFSKLNQSLLLESLKKNVANSQSQYDIANLLSTAQIQINFENFDHTTFVETMQALQISLASHRLLGGYCLLLQSKFVSKGLKGCIYQVLGIEENIKELTDKDILRSIKLLKQYIEFKPSLKINTEFFGGFDKFKTKVYQVELALLNVGEEPKPEEKSALLL
ncbi:hypothetical protein [Legionella waltersii]|uniref:Substrate of the Dot/Icm secretion system n=1 Tax=Legionella waltersii TaxID=66969 RepID=A0A0W1AAN6_9GAMM|nr:hypothetical protein [Legionella waltersii]KTD78421.1 substrate of the Dot/Icm secretion system [Legionella waltersii]SNV06137.1 Dot/Icm secretion system substrate [Legionella waltersii]